MLASGKETTGVAEIYERGGALEGPPSRSPTLDVPTEAEAPGVSGGTVLQPSVSATPAPADVPRQAHMPRSAMVNADLCAGSSAPK